ncbi:zinc knuckle, partial [Ancylostoma duodenale]
ESSTIFAGRLLNLVRAATAGQDSNTQKERVVEKFVARLRSDTRYFIKLDNPTTFEQAVAKAQTLKQLLSEAAPELLMNPTAAPQTVVVGSVASPSYQNRVTFRDQYARRGTDSSNNNRPLFQEASIRRRMPPRDSNSGNETTCYNCGGTGHLAKICPATPLWPRRGTLSRGPERSSEVPRHESAANLGVSDKASCERLREGRLRYQQFAQQENLDLSDQDRDEFMLAEEKVSETLGDVIAIKFAVHPPDVLCIKTASLLNASDEKVIFAGAWDDFSVLIRDEASQVPESVFVAIAYRSCATSTLTTSTS